MSKKSKNMPLTVTDLVDTPRTSRSGSRGVTELPDLEGDVRSTDTLLAVRNGRAYKISRTNLLNQVVTSDGSTGGTLSAGAGNQYVAITVEGTTYKVLHDGTV